jgi:sugar lactone lactonase YvrE
MRSRVYLFLALWAATPIFGQRIITTVAGTEDSSIPSGATALQAALAPFSVAWDGAGNFYIVSEATNRLMKVDPAGGITVVAGNGFGTFSGDGGPAVNASLWQPYGVAVDKQGNIYIADGRNNRLRKVDPNGIITTVVGTGAAAWTDGGGVGTLAATYGPQRVTVDQAGNVYFTDLATVRKLDINGKLTIVAGSGVYDPSGPNPPPDPSLSDGGPATAATLAGPMGIAVDPNGNIFFLEAYSSRIRRIDGATGIITTIAGNGTVPFSGDGGPAISASLYYPVGLSIDPAGNLYVADYGHSRIRKIDTKGVITTVAGTGAQGYGDETGPAVNEPVANMSDVAADAAGNVLIADTYSGRVRKIDAQGMLSTAAGSGRKSAPDDGFPALHAHLSPFGLALDKQQNLIVADGNNLIKRLNSDGTMSTIAGTGRTGYSGDGGSAQLATFNIPQGVAVDASGNIFVGDTYNSRIRKITPDGIVNTFASAGLIMPEGLAFDSAGNLIAADAGTNRVLRITPAGAITTVAGTGTQGYSGDGGPAAAAMLNQPGAVAFDANGNLLIADTYNHLIRRVDAKGNIATLVGGGSNLNPPDGTPANGIKLFWPGGIAVDKTGTIYISDSHQSRVFQLTAQGTLVNVAGIGEQGISGDGGPAVNAALNICAGLAVDSAGNLFIADNYSNIVREVLAAAPQAQISAQTFSFSASSNGAPAQSQTIALSSSLVGGAFTVSASTSDGGTWLKTSTTQGHTPANINISADPAGMAAGTYQGTVSVNMPGFSPAISTVGVAFLVLPGAAPQLSLQPGTVSFAAPPQNQPASQIVFVNNSNGAVTFQTSQVTDSGGNWLQVSSVNSTATESVPGSIMVVADTSNLSPGTYTGSIILTAAGTSTRVPVSLTVTPQNKAHILTSQTGLSFTATNTGFGGFPQYFGILNTGAGIMNWTVSASGQANGTQWLTTSSTASGASLANSLQVPMAGAGVNAANMTPGTYKGTITIVSPDADNSPQVVNVTLQVIDRTQTLPPQVRPTGLIFTTPQGAASPGSQASTVFNFGQQPINYSATSSTLSGGTWMQISPANGKVDSAVNIGNSQLSAQLSTPALNAGIYDGGISLYFGNNNFQNVAVLLVVVPAGTLAGSANLRAADAGGVCQPGKVRVVFTDNEDNFTATQAQPFSIGLRVVDDCGNPVRTGSVVASFSNGDPAIPLVSLNNGQWGGTWFPRQRATGSVGILVQAQMPSGAFGSAQLRGAIQ